MKTNLKSLSRRYVHTYSDLTTGLLGRNDSVKALKAILKSIKTKKLLNSFDQITPGKDPQQSFMNVMDWLESINSGVYFRVEEGDYRIGIVNIDDMKYSILNFPLDFLPVLAKINQKLSNLAMRSSFAFIGYHTIADPVYGSRVCSDDWIIGNLEETIDSMERDRDRDSNRAEINDYRITLKSYTTEYEDYRSRLAHYSGSIPSVHKCTEELKEIQVSEKLQFIVDILLELLSLCRGRSLSDYTEEAADLFFHLNDMLDENGHLDDEAVAPLGWDERVVFPWAGEGPGGFDYTFYEIEACVNSIESEYGHSDYCLDRIVDKDFSLDRFFEKAYEERKFFLGLKSVFEKWGSMRKEIMFNNLKEKVANEHQIRIPSF